MKNCSVNPRFRKIVQTVARDEILDNCEETMDRIGETDENAEKHVCHQLSFINETIVAATNG